MAQLVIALHHYRFKILLSYYASDGGQRLVMDDIPRIALKTVYLGRKGFLEEGEGPPLIKKGPEGPFFID